METWNKKELFIRAVTPSKPVRVAGRFAFRQSRHVLGAVFHAGEAAFNRVRFAWKIRLGLLDRIEVLPYRGHGTQDSIYIKGRVLEGKGITPSSHEDTALGNLRNMIRRFNSSEIPNAIVRGRRFGIEVETKADDEGFFELRLDFPEDKDPDEKFEWHPVEMELRRPGKPGSVRTRGWSLVPSEDAEFYVISDLDDTVLDSRVTNLLAMLWIVLFNNAHTRLPFPGVAVLYEALKGGSDGERRNPLFYVSSGPWNIYDLLVEFMDVHEVPLGPIFLKDWSLNVFGSHEDHKLGAIQRLLSTYRNEQFILIGDSGEEDPEIYAKAIHQNPGRIKAAFIRDVTGAARREEVRDLAAELTPADARMYLVRDSGEAAEIAAKFGLMTRESVRKVYENLP
ncbi:MAG: App1 family protein [Rubrobacter sp.]